MKIYEFEPNKMYKNPITGIDYMFDTSGECGGKPAFISNEGGLWDYCFLSYGELLAMDFVPALEKDSEEKPQAPNSNVKLDFVQAAREALKKKETFFQWENHYDSQPDASGTGLIVPYQDGYCVYTSSLYRTEEPMPHNYNIAFFVNKNNQILVTETLSPYELEKHWKEVSGITVTTIEELRTKMKAHVAEKCLEIPEENLSRLTPRYQRDAHAFARANVLFSKKNDFLFRVIGIRSSEAISFFWDEQTLNSVTEKWINFWTQDEYIGVCEAAFHKEIDKQMQRKDLFSQKERDLLSMLINLPKDIKTVRVHRDRTSSCFPSSIEALVEHVIHNRVDDFCVGDISRITYKGKTLIEFSGNNYEATIEQVLASFYSAYSGPELAVEFPDGSTEFIHCNDYTSKDCQKFYKDGCKFFYTGESIADVRAQKEAANRGI